MKRIFLIVLAPIVPATLCMGQTPLGWPEVKGQQHLGMHVNSYGGDLFVARHY